LAEKTKPSGSGIILEAAAKLFTERGYANVSIRDVCKEANTTPPMIYYYFKNKKGLFEAAVSHRVSMRDFITLLREHSKLAEDAEEGISTFVDLYLSAFPTGAFEPGLYLRETAKLDRGSAARISSQLEEVRAIAATIIHRGVTEGRFRRIDVQSASGCLLGMLNHVVFQQFHFSRSRDLKKSKRFITDFFLSAMRPG
jgi:TetR/AcrR family transcriptional regulator